MDGYCRGSHSKYSLKVHIIFVTKYRNFFVLAEVIFWITYIVSLIPLILLMF